MGEYGKKTFVSNILIMTSTMIIIRIIGMIFNIYFTSAIGSDSTGMFHLIFSVYGFLVTLSVAGTGLAVTRLVSESGTSSGNACRNIVRKGLTISVCASTAVTIAVWLFNDIIGKMISGNAQSTRAIMILALSLPSVAVSSVLKGYFTAVRKTAFITVSQLSEEISSVIITLYILSKIHNSPYGYMALIGGITLSSAIGALADILMYRAHVATLYGGSAIPPGYGSIFAISIPTALGAYLRSALISAENLLIPGALEASGIARPLSEYGIIKGMSIPLMLFPTVFVTSLSNMLVPELADRRAGNKPNGIRYIASRSIGMTLYFSFATAGVFLICHDFFAEVFYRNAKVGYYLGLLSLLVIPMYLDTVVDSMLKGLNQQVSSLRYNIIDSCLRICFIIIIIPRRGVMSYIFLLYASEIFNLCLSIRRLLKVTGLRLRASVFTKPLAALACAFVVSAPLNDRTVLRAVAFVVIYTAISFVAEKSYYGGKNSFNKQPHT